MKREIKLRAWDLVNMVENVSIHEHYWYTVSGGERGPYYDFETYPVMQFTGLIDKNGKEIYEGDIIEHWDNKYIVPNFTPLDRSYQAENVLENHDGSDDWMSMSNVDWEVIGNIYENPELLK